MKRSLTALAATALAPVAAVVVCGTPALAAAAGPTVIASSRADAAAVAAPRVSASTAKRAAAVALAQLGDRYVFGGRGPDEFDCSGLVYYSYRQVGVEIAGSVATQRRETRPLSSDEQFRPGDLIFYSPKNHVAIYQGEGWMVEAANASVPVRRTAWRSGGELRTYRR